MPYPVSNEILQEALEYIYSDNKWAWCVQDHEISIKKGKKIVMYEGGEFPSREYSPFRTETLENLLKPRLDWPGSIDMSDETLAAARDYSGTDMRRLPEFTRTGEEYVNSCKFYDKAMELHTAAQEPKQTHKLPVNFDVFQNALNSICCGGFYATAFSISLNEDVFWTAKDGIDERCAREFPTLMSRVTHLLESRRHPRGWSEASMDVRQRLVKSQLKKTGLDNVWPELMKTGAEYVEACTWYDRVEAELVDGVGMVPIPAPGETFSNIAPEGPHPMFGQQQLEQPWERQARVAMSAGYAHVPPDEKNKNRSPWPVPAYGFAHDYPADPLSGTRTINGWAICGFAVTTSGPLHGTTSSDVQLGDDD